MLDVRYWWSAWLLMMTGFAFYIVMYFSLLVFGMVLTAFRKAFNQ